jgi:hypothetical protein
MLDVENLQGAVNVSNGLDADESVTELSSEGYESSELGYSIRKISAVRVN